MKLYTEEQVKSMIYRAKIFDGNVGENFVYILSESDILSAETPIELPSDEEVEDAALFVYSDYPSESKEDCDRDVNAHKKRRAFNMGAHWTLNQIRRQDNE